MLSISRTDLNGGILFQIVADILAMDARRLLYWLYFHTGVNELSTLLAVIDRTSLFMLLLWRTLSAKAWTVSIPPITWLPKILSPAPWVPMLPKFSPIPLSRVEVFYSSSERRNCPNSALATLRAPPDNKSLGSIPLVSPVLESIIDRRSLISLSI